MQEVMERVSQRRR